MKNVAWFVVGWLFAYQVAQLFPNRDGLTMIFSSFIMEPLRFLEGAIFILASFIIFSYSIRYLFISLIKHYYKKRREAMVYGMISTIIIVISWLVLLLQSRYITLAIVLLTLVHLGLSMEGFKKATYNER